MLLFSFVPSLFELKLVVQYNQAMIRHLLLQLRAAANDWVEIGPFGTAKIPVKVQSMQSLASSVVYVPFLVFVV